MPNPAKGAQTTAVVPAKNKGGRPRKVPAHLDPIDYSPLTRKAPRSVGAFIEKILKLYAPHMLPMLMEETRKAMNAGDPAALERAARMFGLIGSKGIVINNTANAASSANASSGGGDRGGFESVIRKLNAETNVIDVRAR